MNSTEAEASVYSEPLAFEISKFILYVIILVLSSVGNTMVIIIICRFKHMKRMAGNLFIVNLALCDLLTPLISIPLEMALVENDNTWVLGSALCKLLPPAATFFTTSSSLTLAAISLDRYRTLMHPFKRRLDARAVKILITFVHCCSGILVTPHIVTSKLSPTVQCVEVWPNKWLPKMYTFVLFIGQYAGPLVFMAAMYIFAAHNLFVATQKARSVSISSTNFKRKRNGWLKSVTDPRKSRSHGSLERHFRKNNEHNAQITKVFIAIVLVFAVFTLPVEVLWIWGDFAGGVNHRLFPTIAVVCRLFTYANSCLNPIIFYKFSRDFHRGFITFFRCRSSCRADGTLTRANASFSCERNGKTSPLLLTPLESLQSTPRPTTQGSFQGTKQSISFANQGKTSHKITMGHNFNVPCFDYNAFSKFPSAESTSSKSRKEANQTRDIAKYLNSKTFSSEEGFSNRDCNISVKAFFYECDLTIELDKLESLLVLPQTDC